MTFKQKILFQYNFSIARFQKGGGLQDGLLQNKQKTTATFMKTNTAHRIAPKTTTRTQLVSPSNKI